jgi:hypothetical protein
MSRAYGSRAQLLGKTESVYGTAPVGDWTKLPFVSSSLGSEQGLIASDVLGYGRDPVAPMRDVINVTGDVVVPVDVRNIGFWLRALFGAATVTGEGGEGEPYQHTFKSGANSLPSVALEVGMPEVPAYFAELGVRANSIALNFTRSGPANATINCLAQGEVRAGSSGGGTPAALGAFEPFSQFQGSIKKDGVALGNVTGATLLYTNNVEGIPTIRADGKIDGADPTVAGCTGTIDVRFGDTDLMALAESGDALWLELAYTKTAGQRQIVWTVHQVYLPKAKVPITGPGGIQASYAWQSAQDPVAPLEMLTVDLYNDLAAYS